MRTERFAVRITLTEVFFFLFQQLVSKTKYIHSLSELSYSSGFG